MNEHKNKEWRVEGCHPVRYVISGGDIWLSQRSISEIFGLSVKTINEHLIGLMKNMGDESCRVFVMTQQEGVREISRPIKHYPLSLVYGVGIKSQRFDKLEELKTLADREGVETKGLVISSNKEYVFGKLLTGVLDGIAEVFPQHFVDPFFIDFYIPAFNLAVEYDDEYHFSDKQREKDGNRQDKIESRTGMKFIRVKEGYEAQGINDVLKTILLARRGELDERAEFEKAWTSYPGRKTPIRFDDGEYQYPAANTAWKFWQARAALAQQDADKVDAEPDMFWDDDDPERCQDSIHNVIVEVQCNRDLSVGDVVEVQRAIRLPNASVRITAVENEDGSGDLEYEVIDSARKEQA